MFEVAIQASLNNRIIARTTVRALKKNVTLDIFDDAIEGGTAVCPWVFVQNRAASQDRLITLDYFMVGQRRS